MFLWGKTAKSVRGTCKKDFVEEFTEEERKVFGFHFLCLKKKKTVLIIWCGMEPSNIFCPPLVSFRQGF